MYTADNDMDHKRKIVTIVKMSCTWVDNSRAAKDQDKREKYPPLRLELKQQFKGYSIDQHNIILDRRVASYTQIRTCVLEVTRNF